MSYTYYDKNNLEHTADLITDAGTIAVDVRKLSAHHHFVPDLAIVDLNTKKAICTYHEMKKKGWKLVWLV